MSADEPLDAELVALLRSERVAPAPPADLLLRVQAKITHAIDAGPGFAQDHGTQHLGANGEVASAAASAGSSLAAKLGLLAVFGAGIGVGATSHALLVENSSTIVTIYSGASATLASSNAIVSVPPPPQEVPVEPVRSAETPLRKGGDGATSRSAEVDGSVVGRDTDLAAERNLIDTARAALARGDSAGTLAVLGRHQREFSKGKLVEEREALRVLALVRSGKGAEARQQGAQFQRAYPQSFFGKAIEAALQTIP